MGTQVQDLWQGEPEANRPLGRIGRLQEANINMDLKINKMGKCGLD